MDRVAWGTRGSLVATIVVAAALALVSNASAAHSSSISVVFKGTGTYTVHQFEDGTANGGCTGTTNDTFTFGWETHYMVAEPNDAGVRVAGSVPGTVTVGPGTFNLTGDATSGDGCATVTPTNCHGTLLLGSSPPTMQYGVGFGQDTFNAQSFSLTYGGTPACQGQTDQSESGLVNADIMIFVNFVPATMMEGFASGSDASVRAGTLSASVSQPSSPPGDCSSLLGPDYAPAVYTCSESLSWSGTVATTTTNPCADSQRACVDPQEKQDANSAASGYRSAFDSAQEQWKGLGCGVGAGSFDGNDQKFACAALSAMKTYDHVMDLDEQAIANDPPAGNYKKIAPTKRPKVKQLSGKNTQAINRLDDDLAYAGVLAGGMITSVDRACGALDAKDGSALKQQNDAAFADARLATKTLQAAVALLPSALSKLGSVHERGYKKLRSVLTKLGPGLKADAADAETIFVSFDAQAG